MADKTSTDDDHGLAKAEAKEAYDALRAALDRLASAIRDDDHDRDALVHRLPTRRKGDAQDRPWFGGALQGNDARRHAAEIVRQIHFFDGDEQGGDRDASAQDRRSVVRAPGVIAATADTIAHARVVNHAKRRFDTAMATLRQRLSRHERRQVVHQFAPNLSLVQASRALLCLDHTPDEIHFGWAKNTSASVRVRVGDKRRELERRLEHGPTDGRALNQWRRIAARALELLADVPENEIIVERFVLAPHPRVALYHYQREAHGELDKGERSQHAAGLPLLVPDDGDDLPPISQLPPLDPRMLRSRARSDRIVEATPLVKGLGLHRYKPGYRERQRPGEAAQAPADADTAPCGDIADADPGGQSPRSQP